MISLPKYIYYSPIQRRFSLEQMAVGLRVNLTYAITDEGIGLIAEFGSYHREEFTEGQYSDLRAFLFDTRPVLPDVNAMLDLTKLNIKPKEPDDSIKWLEGEGGNGYSVELSFNIHETEEGRTLLSELQRGCLKDSDLEIMLTEAVRLEDYEEAAYIRDELQRRNTDA